MPSYQDVVFFTPSKVENSEKYREERGWPHHFNYRQTLRFELAILDADVFVVLGGIVDSAALFKVNADSQFTVHVVASFESCR